jgi:hypothetical protein
MRKFYPRTDDPQSRDSIRVHWRSDVYDNDLFAAFMDELSWPRLFTKFIPVRDVGGVRPGRDVCLVRFAIV